MLKQLNIRNFAIIDEIELDFGPGLTVLTGETGAGKSILIDALGLILGDRAESDVIRDGCDRTEIAAVFDIKNCRTVIELLAGQEIEYENDELILRRIIARDGRSRAFVNNCPATVQFLRSLGEYLIDIHGQHAHQSLMKPENQRLLLDNFGAYPREINAVSEAYHQWHSATTRLKALLDNNTDHDAAMALLRYQVEELVGVSLKPGEYELLDEEHRRMANSSRLLETTSNALNVFREDDDSVLSRIESISNNLRELQQYDEKLVNLIRILDEATIQISEAGDELRIYLDNLQIDPDRLQEVEERLSVIHDMARKHRVQPAELAAHLEKLGNQLEEMENSRQIINELLELQNEALNQYKKASEVLNGCRTRAAQAMSSGISGKLRGLGMPNGIFSIEVEFRDDQTPRPSGNDRIEYMVSMNPGQAPKPLRKIASGGELSRISLAIQVVGSKDKGIPSLIFDEVDAGIGGGIAEIVGKMLHSLTVQRQVFCVTHLAQVASQGDHHLQVNKESSKKATWTIVKELDPAERIEEIARMIGGVKITEQSRQHAKEMLAQ